MGDRQTGQQNSISNLGFQNSLDEEFYDHVRELFDEVRAARALGRKSGNTAYVGEDLPPEKMWSEARADVTALELDARDRYRKQSVRNEIEVRQDLMNDIPSGGSRDVSFVVADLAIERHLNARVLTFGPNTADLKVTHRMVVFAPTAKDLEAVVPSLDLKSPVAARVLAVDVDMGIFCSLENYPDFLALKSQNRATKLKHVRNELPGPFVRSDHPAWQDAINAFPRGSSIERSYRSLPELIRHSDRMAHLEAIASGRGIDRER